MKRNGVRSRILVGKKWTLSRSFFLFFIKCSQPSLWEYFVFCLYIIRKEQTCFSWRTWLFMMTEVTTPVNCAQTRLYLQRRLSLGKVKHIGHLWVVQPKFSKQNLICSQFNVQGRFVKTPSVSPMFVILVRILMFAGLWNAPK